MRNYKSSFKYFFGTSSTQGIDLKFSVLSNDAWNIGDTAILFTVANMVSFPLDDELGQITSRGVKRIALHFFRNQKVILSFSNCVNNVMMAEQGATIQLMYK